MLAALAILGVAFGLMRLQGDLGGGSALSAPRPIDVPPASTEVAEAPIGSAPRPSAESTSYRYISTQPDSGEPVRWDPCRPIHYVVRPSNAPPGGSKVIGAALAEVSRVTGLTFVDDGTTNETPDIDREPYQPDRYGERWAPVLIAWATRAEVPAFDGEVAGQAGPAPISWGPHPPVYATGSVSLDAKTFATLLAGPARRTPAARAIVMHEVAHLVGLDHVQDPEQIMYPQASLKVTRFAAGDLAGLWNLGRGQCAPWL